MLKEEGGFDFLSYAGDLKKILKDFPVRYFAMTKSGPGTSGSMTSMFAIPHQANAWLNPANERIYSALDGWCILFGIRHITSVIQKISIAWSYGYIRTFVNSYNPGAVGSHPFCVVLGKLGFKEEPGKVRVFAMVDYFTQVIMSPLHQMIFKLLKGVAQDGTHDQLRPIERLIFELDRLERRRAAPGFAKSKLGSVWNKVKIGRCHSFDLSAATDRLPVDYQALIVQQLHPKLGVTWKELLVGRDYYISDFARKKYDPDLPAKVRYSTGQPMGALSSWAMLALTHHVIVQWAAWRVGWDGWFKFYAILGDDVVIAHDNVALEYLRIMKTLGVGISKAKTLTGLRSMEFAKRFILRGEDVSPFSLKEFLIAQGSVSAMIELVRKAKKVNALRMSDIVKAYGWRFRVSGSLDRDLWTLGSRVRGLLLLLLHPGNPFGVSDYLQWLFLRTRSSSYEIVGEALSRMVQSFESTIFGRLEELVKRRSDGISMIMKFPSEVKVKGHRKKADKSSDAQLPVAVMELMRDHILFPIQSEVLDRMEHVREDVRSRIAYYRTVTKVIQKTPEEKTELILGIIRDLEERVASLPETSQIWWKPKSSDPKTSSKTIVRWNRVRALVLSGGLLQKYGPF
jgi:hypothetical protein